MKWPIRILIVIAVLWWWLYEPTPSEEEVIGIYNGNYKGYVDQLWLTEDHKFKQVVITPDGEKLTSTGTWKLKHRALDLNGYRFFIDRMNNRAEWPTKTSIRFAAYKKMLVQDWDSDFYKLDQQENNQ